MDATWQQWIWWMTAAATLLQLVYWIFVFGRLACYRPKPLPPAGPSEQPPVSIIICARNEAENLRRHLPDILTQAYPCYEVIVVNDNSSDKSWEIILDIQNKYPILQPINLQELTPPGKKAALSRGIEAARFDTLLLTDADCRPASRHWLSHMATAFRNDVKIVLGYSPYVLHSGFLHIFIHFEAVFTAIQYLSFALLRLPYMGVGRNLAYVKQLFHEHGGFGSHYHIASGDDDLFINRAANGRNTAIVIHPDAFMWSTPKSTWRGYYYQKSRHLSTGSRYRFSHQLLLGVLAGSHVMHYLGVLILLPTAAYTSGIAMLFLVRIGVVLVIYARILKLLRAYSLWPWIPILDASLTLYYLFLSPVLFTTGNLKKWKL